MTMNFDPTTPAGSDPKSQGDDHLRALKTHVAGALGIAGESIWDLTDPSAPRHHYQGVKGVTLDQPAAAVGGLFFDTDRQVLQRSNGSTWDDIAGNFAAGTKLIFPQAAAPVGWTKDVVFSGAALRVVTDGSGGTGAGDHDPATTISLHHHHTTADHTHGMGLHTHSTPTHQHELDESVSTGVIGGALTSVPVHASGNGAALDAGGWGGGGTHTLRQQLATTGAGQGSGTSGTPSTNTTDGSGALDTDAQLTDVSLAYVNSIICSKA